jgi:hypothetical protein
MRRIEEKITDLSLAVERLGSSMMPRSEIERQIDDRVSVTTFQQTVKSLDEKISKLENGPAKMVPWLALGCSAVGIFVSGLIGTIGILVSIYLR